jgi:ArsR family transcriptional regulator
MSARPGEAQAVRVAKALGDPMRFRILSEIAARGEVSVRELVERLPIAQPTISHHLKVLAEVLLVTVRRVGSLHLYRARREALEEHRRLLAEMAADVRVTEHAP